MDSRIGVISSIFMNITNPSFSFCVSSICSISHRLRLHLHVIVSSLEGLSPKIRFPSGSEQNWSRLFWYWLDLDWIVENLKFEYHKHLLAIAFYKYFMSHSDNYIYWICVIPSFICAFSFPFHYCVIFVRGQNIRTIPIRCSFIPIFKCLKIFTAV